MSQSKAIELAAKFVGTNEAAVALDLKAQTLRKRACKGTGPIKPIRRNGRLYWRWDDVVKAANGEVPHE